jgi:hypothetical protein
MSNLSINAEAKFLLDGVKLNAPLEWEDIEIVAEYENDSIQPSLAVEEFVFPLEAREAINEWIARGLTNGVGIFEGMPFQLTLFNNQPIQENFKAFIDFTNGYQDLPEDGKVNIGIIPNFSLDNFFEQIEGTTFGYLQEIGAITLADYIKVDYVVEKKFNLIEFLISSIILYLMIKELQESIRRTGEAISIASGIFSAGFTGSVGQAIYLVANAIIQIIYTSIILIAVVSLATTLLETLLPKKRTHKAIKLKTALERVCQNFGYSFVTDIPQLENVVYLPSNPNLDDSTLGGLISFTKGTPVGIPYIGDYGYRCSEMFELAKNLFNAKIAIINGVVEFRSKNSTFWIQQSTWNLPDVLLENLQYNTDEIKPERILSFETDLNDEWTIDNYKGTAYEIRTSPKTVVRKRAVLLKGIEEINFNTCLGNRKDELNPLEKFLSEVAGFIDKTTGVLGGGTNFKSKITSKIGVLKVTNNWHSIPKLLYLDGGRIPLNHRDLWNSEILYNQYHSEKSFVLNNWKGQKKVYKSVRVPFGFEDYKQLTTNSYFLFKGKQAKIVKFVWTIGKDFAEIDFWVREPYTFNLKETYINPE